MAVIDDILHYEMLMLKVGVDIIKDAAKLPMYRRLLVLCYGNEVFKHGLPPIELLPQELKNQIWEETKKDSAGLDKRGCIELSKIIYLISSKI